MTTDSIIYLVEDDEAVRTSLSRALKVSGYEVRDYGSGKAFLEDVELDRDGCIILDASMPEMSGLEIHSRLKQINCAIPVIFITGAEDIAALIKAVDDISISFLQKPFRVNSLLRHITIAVNKQGLRHFNDKADRESLEPRSDVNPSNDSLSATD